MFRFIEVLSFEIDHFGLIIITSQIYEGGTAMKCNLILALLLIIILQGYSIVPIPSASTLTETLTPSRIQNIL